MTEPREPYIAGRNKWVKVKAVISHHIPSVEFEIEFKEWLEKRGYAYGGLIEVIYEEEGK